MAFTSCMPTMSGEEVSSQPWKSPVRTAARRPFTFHEQILSDVTDGSLDEDACHDDCRGADGGDEHVLGGGSPLEVVVEEVMGEAGGEVEADEDRKSVV